ncbi:Transcription elongation factor 1 [Vanrija pseudolonga]|uniref:Transcription elongation factor 1 homolog n=1 Tax=Vanrija pseudolonga TaxID=143232 RepID=A0AAF0YCL8_9TREE|nr:Transcription elongation factor 1 [Vanrija pseudolonga]
MGKRKSSKKPMVRKQNEPLSTTFKCLFCHHEKSVMAKIDRQAMFGHLSCKACGQKFSTPINNLSAAVDVYCDWVDACEELRVKQPPKKAKAAPRSRTPPPASALADDDDDDDIDHLASARRDKESKRKSARSAYDDDDEDDDVDDDRARKVARRAYDDDDDDDED